MPLEVSPIPFSDQQLPYTPKFVPQSMGDVLPSGASVASGPASVQANALIPPAPGGVAGPHHAIPALPEAGYTAPTMRAAPSLGTDLARARSIRTGYDAPSAYGPPETVYAGASMYGGPPRVAQSVISDGWASSSLPEPRRAGVPPVPVSHTDEGHRPGQHAHHHHHHLHHQHGVYPDPRAHEHEHHEHREHREPAPQHQHAHDEQHRHRRHRSADIDDGASDASYYARPKIARHRSDASSHGNGHGHPHRSPAHHSPLATRDQRLPSPAVAPPPTTQAPDERHRRSASLSCSQAHAHSPSPSHEHVQHQHHHGHRRAASFRAASTDSPVAPRLAPAPAEVAPTEYAGGPRGGRRRAMSMLDHAPPSRVDMQMLDPAARYAPSLGGYAGAQEYDDGGSVAGSAMTFMDGSVGGRVSQYGLPKYPHRPKVDYRRFCVQRGNADVFLD